MSVSVSFYSEEEFDPLYRGAVKTLEGVSDRIRRFEEETGEVVDFVEVLESEDARWYLVNDDAILEEADSELTEELASAYSDDDSDLMEEAGWFEDLLVSEHRELSESLRKRVNSKGKVTRVKSRKIRSRNAVRTTGLSKSKLRRRARKAARTLRRNPAVKRKALRKRKRTMRKRRSLGIR